MAELYTKQAKSALLWAAKNARQNQHGYIGTEHILLGLLEEGSGTAGMVLAEHGVDREQLRSLIDRLIAPGGSAVQTQEPGYTPRAEKVLKNSQEEAAHYGSQSVGTEHILIGMLKEPDCVGTRLLYTLGVNLQKLYAGVLAAMGEDPGREELSGQRGKSGEAGTPTLDTYSRDLTEMARQGKLDPVVGREQEIERIIQILSRRTKNNPCLIGEPGVGKTAIAEGLAQRIAWGLVPETIQKKRVVVLDLSGMVAG